MRTERKKGEIPRRGEEEGEEEEANEESMSRSEWHTNTAGKQVCLCSPAVEQFAHRRQRIKCLKLKSNSIN